MKHVQWLNAIFVNLEKTDCTISDEKSQFYVFELKIVNFDCDSNDISSEIAKMIKILEWSFCRDVSKVRAFINVCGYYRIWIINFIIIAFLFIIFWRTKSSLCEQKNRKRSWIF